METLSYRATVFVRPVGSSRASGMELMERAFADEQGAVCWCRVMTEAFPNATGRWMVARAKAGRMLELVRENSLVLVPSERADAGDEVVSHDIAPVAALAIDHSGIDLIPAARSA